MRIDSVEVLRADKYTFVALATDTGLVGYGEAGLWAFPDTQAAALTEIGATIVGRNALNRTDIYQDVYRYMHFRGAAISGALSAIDIALWDLAGKRYDAPIYDLLGGRVRDRARVYKHIDAPTREGLVDNALDAVSAGYSAVRFNVLELHGPVVGDQRIIDNVVGLVADVRGAVGPDIDICLECHFRLNRATALAVARAVEPFHVFFMEDPLPPEDLRGVVTLAKRTRVPLAVGERLQTLEEYGHLLSGGHVTYVRPDIALAGGFTQLTKIAAVAAAHGARVIPHNYLSPLTTAASVQLDMATPNFALQEYLGDDPADSVRGGILSNPLVREGAHLLAPDGPGLGVMLDLDYLRSLEKCAAPVRAARDRDGGVIDQ